MRKKKSRITPVSELMAPLYEIWDDQVLHTHQIHDIVEISHNLTKADREPYTTTRETTYPRWTNSVNGELSRKKKAGELGHCAKSQAWWRIHDR